mgnify:CR=1 FL=1
MAEKIKVRGSQPIQVAEFTFTIGDTMTNVSGAADAFASVAAHVFDIIPQEAGMIVVGGDVVTETAFTGCTAYNVKVGDATSDTRYLGSTDRVAAGHTALVPTGFVSTGEAIRLTVTPTVAAATAGKLTVRVHYIKRNRMTENLL